MLPSQYGAVVEDIPLEETNNQRIIRTIEIDGKLWPVFTNRQLNAIEKKSLGSKILPIIMENDPYKSQSKLSSLSILSSSKEMDSSLPKSNAFEPDPTQPYTTSVSQPSVTTTPGVVEGNALQSHFELPQANDENDDEAWKRFLL